MPFKPTVLLEGWQMFWLHGRPHHLFGFASSHPRLPGHRRFIRTSRVLQVSTDLASAETLNTNYQLRHAVTDVSYEGVDFGSINIADLVARFDATSGLWRICRAEAVLASDLTDVTTVMLAMLAILDRDQSGRATETRIR